MNFLTMLVRSLQLRNDRVAVRSLTPLIALLAAALVAGCASSAPPSPTPSAGADLHAWPELEQRLPDTIGGRSLSKVSLAAHRDRQDRKTLAVLERLGRSTDHLQLANAELEGTDLMIGAMRVVGAQGGQIIDAFEGVDAADPQSEAIYSDVNLAGKRVTARTVDGSSTYLYGAEDIMFVVAGERELVEAALAKLP